MVTCRHRELLAARLAARPREAVHGGDEHLRVPVGGPERPGGQRRERERADDRREHETAALGAPSAGGAAGGGDEVVAETGEIGRESHVPYMGGPPWMCQPTPPQAGGTRTGISREIEPSPGRPLILQ
jgi:hypothetical protein